MATNPFFYENRASIDSDLLDDLVTECIQITGINCWYVRKTFQNIDEILGEDNLMKFVDAFLLEFYLESSSGFGGEGQLVSKFGIEVKNRLEFSVSAKRFIEETHMTRPMEGDLIWFPLSGCFFEILFVEENVPFYELGHNYIFKLPTQTWTYGHEPVTTSEIVLNQYASDKIDKEDAVSDNDEFNNFGNETINDTNIFGVKITNLGS